MERLKSSVLPQAEGAQRAVEILKSNLLPQAGEAKRVFERLKSSVIEYVEQVPEKSGES